MEGSALLFEFDPSGFQEGEDLILQDPLWVVQMLAMSLTVRKRRPKVAVIGHSYPDLDLIGSFGLISLILRATCHIQPTCYFYGTSPRVNLDGLPFIKTAPLGELAVHTMAEEPMFVIALDCHNLSEPHVTGVHDPSLLPKPNWVIDHHPFSSGFQRDPLCNYHIDQEARSTSLILWEMYLALRRTFRVEEGLPPEALKKLFSIVVGGVVTDLGRNLKEGICQSGISRIDRALPSLLRMSDHNLLEELRAGGPLFDELQQRASRNISHTEGLTNCYLDDIEADPGVAYMMSQLADDANEGADAVLFGGHFTEGNIIKVNFRGPETLDVGEWAAKTGLGGGRPNAAAGTLTYERFMEGHNNPGEAWQHLVRHCETSLQHVWRN